jgi:hypothetical protein
MIPDWLTVLIAVALFVSPAFILVAPRKRERSMTFDRYCPFLTCLEPTPHTQAVCRDCGAVRYGNPFNCGRCATEYRRQWPNEDDS